jgi:hypothetical protein
MPEQHIGDIIRGQTASRFGHPDLLRAELRDATEYVRLLDEQRDDLVAGLARIADDPELDDLEEYSEAQFQLQIIAALGERRDAEMRRAIAARERLEGAPDRAADASFWAPFRY